MSATFASLTYPNYRIWFGAALVANVGTWMQRIAQDWLVLTELTDDSGVALGITTALQFLPFLLLGPWTGLLADRLPRRALLITTQSAMGLLALGLGALVLSGNVELWHVYAFAFGLGVATAFDNPVRQTFVADLVPPERLANAVGLNSASFNAARLVGPGAAGLLIAAVGSGWVFVINGFTFAATIAAVALMSTAGMHAVPRVPRGKGQIREGLRYVRGRSDIVVIMVVMMLVSSLGLGFQLTSAMMARIEFGLGAQEFGLLGTVLAVGSLAGALVAARRERPRVRLVIGSAFAFGLSTVLMALAPTYPLYVLSCVPVGFFALTMITAANSTVQTSTDPAMRGRVMALYMMVFLGAVPLGSPVVGWVGETFGPRYAIGLGALVALGAATWATIWAVRNWHLRVRYRLVRRPHLEVVYLDVPDPAEVHTRAA